MNRLQPWRRWVIGFLVLVGLLALLPREVSRWCQAAAREAELDGDARRAERWLDRAITWAAWDASVYLDRASVRASLKDWKGALADCQTALERSRDSIEAHFVRASILQQKGEFRAAIPDLDVVVQQWRDRVSRSHAPSDRQQLAIALNARAYVRWLARVQPELARADIDEAFDLAKTPDNHAFLDTRGMVHLLLGNLPEAQRDMELAVTKAEVYFGDGSSQLRHMMQLMVDHRREVRSLAVLQNELAVILYHRALVYQQLGHLPQAEADLARVVRLGFQPGETLW